MNEKTPHELVSKFERCLRYPIDIPGINDLAAGLESASKTTGVPMEDIVAACLPIAKFCPTDAEMLAVARNLRDEIQRDAESRRNQTAEWRQKYGKPEPYDWKAEAAKILPETKKHWAIDARLQQWLRERARERHTTLAKMGQGDYMALLIEGQERFGIETTSEQRKIAAAQ